MVFYKEDVSGYYSPALCDCTFPPRRFGLGAREDGLSHHVVCSPHRLPTSSSFLSFHWGQCADPVEVSPHKVKKNNLHLRGIWSTSYLSGLNVAHDLCPVSLRTHIKEGGRHSNFHLFPTYTAIADRDLWPSKKKISIEHVFRFYTVSDVNLDGPVTVQW